MAECSRRTLVGFVMGSTIGFFSGLAELFEFYNKYHKQRTAALGSSSTGGRPNAIANFRAFVATASPDVRNFAYKTQATAMVTVGAWSSCFQALRCWTRNSQEPEDVAMVIAGSTLPFVVLRSFRRNFYACFFLAAVDYYQGGLGGGVRRKER